MIEAVNKIKNKNFLELLCCTSYPLVSFNIFSFKDIIGDTCSK